MAANTDSVTTKSATTDEFAKLSWRERISYGAGDLAQNLIFGTVGSMLLFYLTTVYGISAAAGATIFLIVRWVNVFWDPWVGAFVRQAQLPGRQVQALPDLRGDSPDGHDGDALPAECQLTGQRDVRLYRVPVDRFDLLVR